jgi:hypothetical protein
VPCQPSPENVVLQETLLSDVFNVDGLFLVRWEFVVLQKLNNRISELVPGLQQRQVRGKHIDFFQRIST